MTLNKRYTRYYDGRRSYRAFLMVLYEFDLLPDHMGPFSSHSDAHRLFTLMD